MKLSANSILLNALLAIFLGAVGLWLYGTTLSYPFHFDDYSNVVFNRGIRYLTNPQVIWENITMRNRPIAALSFSINYYLSGLSLSGFRWWNIALHFGNSFMVGAILWRCFGTNGVLEKARISLLGAVLGAGIMLLHPLAIDTTVYISGRSTLLAFFFPAMAILVYLSPIHWALRVVLFWGLMALGFFSKESAVVFFLILVLLHFWQRKPHKELLVFLTPLIPGFLFFLVTKSSYLKGAWSGYFNLQGDLPVRNFWEFFEVNISLWPKILGMFFLPHWQSIDHQIVNEGWGARFWGGSFLWLIFFLVLIQNLRSPKAWHLPVLWLFLSLSTTNSIFPNLDPMAERHLYVAIPWISMIFLLWFPKNNRWLVPLGFVAVSFVLFSSYRRAGDWESSLKLWTAAHKLYPEKYRIRYNLARALRRDLGDVKGAFKIHWDFLGSQSFTALSYRQQMELMDTLMAQWGAIPEQERNKFVAQNIWQEILINGYRLKQQKHLSLDWKNWRDSVAKREQNERVLSFIQIFEAKKLMKIPGEKKIALQALLKVLGSLPRDHHPYWVEEETLGNLYFEMGDYSNALIHFNLASRIFKVFKQFPRDLHLKLYQIYRSEGDWGRASDALGELVRVYSDDVELRGLYRESLERKGDPNTLGQEGQLVYYRKHSVDRSKESIRP